MKTCFVLAAACGMALGLTAVTAQAQQLPCQSSYREGYSNYANSYGYGRSDNAVAASAATAVLGMVFQHREATACTEINREVISRGLDIRETEMILRYRAAQARLARREEALRSSPYAAYNRNCYPDRRSLTGYAGDC